MNQNIGELKKEIKKKLDHWYFEQEYQILFFWEQDNTYFIISKLKESNLISFIRMFLIGSDWALSQDRKITLDSLV